MSGQSSSCIQSTELRSDMQLTLVLFMLVHSYFFCIVLKLNYDFIIVEPGEKRKAKTKTKAQGRPQTTDHRPQRPDCAQFHLGLDQGVTAIAWY